MQQRGVGCNPCVCQGEFFVFHVWIPVLDPSSRCGGEELGAEAAISVSTFHWEATHKCDWSQESLPQCWAQRSVPVGAGDSAAQPPSCSVLPELSNLALFPPSALWSRPSHPCSFPAPWQTNPCSAERLWMAFLPCCLFSIWVSFFPSPFQACSSLLACPSLWPREPWLLRAAWQGSPLAWTSDCCWMPFPIPHSHSPSASSLFFLPLHSAEFGATSLVTHLLSVSSFLLLFQCSGFIYSVGQAFIFQGDCFSNKAVAQCC